jgi:signal transduction histidine kinase
MKNTPLDSSRAELRRLDDSELQREIDDAKHLVVRPEHLLNSLAYCKIVFDDLGRPCDWLHLYTNPAWEEQSGQPSHAGQYASELFPGIHELDPEILEIFHRIADGGAPERFTRYLRSAHNWYDVQAYCPRRGYFVAVFDIVTDRVEREAELVQAQRRLSLAQVVSKSGMWDWDIPAGALHWTPEMMRLFGVAPGTAVTFETWRSALHPDDLPGAEQRLTEAVQTRNPLSSEFRIVLPGGQVRWIRTHGDTLYDDAGMPSRMLGLSLDVTDLKQLSLAASEAYAANVAKSMFLATMSHELRTPLNSIIGFTTLLLARAAGDITEEQERQLSIVQRSGRQLLELVSDILDIARVETGKILLEPADVHLRPLLVEQVDAIRPLAEARGLAVEVAECDDTIMVRADPRRLSQVVRNLLSNSVKYTDRGAIRIRARDHSDNVVLEFEDTGIGMSAEETHRLFSPFRRSDNPLSAARGGAGLGLSISRSLVQAMGGTMGVESEVGRGSTFSVTLPAAAVDRRRPAP